jgi:Tol biopolymer transport system component/dienelactone hydrolase
MRLNLPNGARLALALFPLAAASVAAQSLPAVTAQDYARAEQYMSWSVAPLVSLPVVRPTWLPDGRFWYRNTTPAGGEFVLVDPAKRTRTRAFDHGRLAAGLQAAGTPADSMRLPFTSIDLAADGKSVAFDVAARRWRCELPGYTCASVGAAQATAAADGRGAARGVAGVTSPNGKLTAFIRDWNLWVRDVATGRETRLTSDGVKDFGYATDNAGWTKSDRAILLWSPDSKRIATFQQDDRNVGEMFLVQSRQGHPALEAWRYPLPGDSVVSMIHRVVINGVEGPDPAVVRLQMAPDFHRSTLCDHVICGGQWADVEWMPDGAHLAFVSTSRDHKREQFRIADVQTGAVRDVFEEKVATFFESGTGAVNWHVLPGGRELLWFSERDDWGNLYVYDLASGTLVRRLTSGPGTVLQVVRVDSAQRAIFFTATGREKGRDPYFQHLYRVALDGKSAPVLLTPEDASHAVTLAPNGRVFVDSYSRPEVPPVTVLRDATTGALLATIERSDISRLLATGWTPPMPFTVKARDGKTDLYGLMFRPTKFDSTRKYPIINHIYPGPQTGSVGSRAFSAARNDARGLAELGFIVIQLDAMGTPMRSKSFHDAYYGDMGDNGLPDQIAGMKQLAQRYAWIDLDKAGIWGHSGGGYAAAGALLRYPEFFKVAISEAGNHDQGEYEDDWGEKYQGLLTRNANGTTSYDAQANQHLAKNLKGKLLIAHGTADDNVPPYNTLLLVDELIKANKDFDLLMLPNRRHGFGNEPYMIRRRWDYFVRNLLGAEPPKEFEFQQPRPAFTP